MRAANAARKERGRAMPGLACSASTHRSAIAAAILAVAAAAALFAVAARFLAIAAAFFAIARFLAVATFLAIAHAFLAIAFLTIATAFFAIVLVCHDFSPLRDSGARLPVRGLCAIGDQRNVSATRATRNLFPPDAHPFRLHA
jgi:hypothetical protein